MSFDANVKAQLVNQLAQGGGGNSTAQLNDALRLLSKWRSVLIQNTLLQNQGTVIHGGPLKGMDFLSQSAEGCHIAKLLGCYEQPLHPFIVEAMRTDYDAVINIGCAEGYYTTGFARAMPQARIFACETNLIAQQACAALAEKNGVADRVTVQGQFRCEDFAAFRNQKTLVFCDIEGSEKDLLDPSQAPEMTQMDLIVEAHECFVPGIVQTLTRRFEASHDIVQVNDNGQRQLDDMPEWFTNLSHLDQLLAVWEWRSGPTPWLIMRVKA